MSNNSPSATDANAHLNAIAGRKIDDLVLPINLFSFLGASVGTTGGQDFPTSFVASISIVNNTVQVAPTPLLDVTGTSATDDTGNVVFGVNHFVGGGVGAVAPINIVATPLGSSPVFLTLDANIVLGDVKVTVHSWNPNGSPAPNVVFNWHCRFASSSD